MVFLSDSASKEAEVINRAKYERDKRSSVSDIFNATVQGFCDENKRLWRINELVELDSPSLDYSGSLLIDSVSFEKNSSGNLTILKLLNPDAHNFKDKAKPKTQNKEVVTG